MRETTLPARRRLYLQARLIVARHYRRELTLAAVARALASSPRALQRAYAQFGELSFSEDLRARRLDAAAELLLDQPAIPVRDVARLVGLGHAPHFARVFRGRYGLAPAEFRRRGRAARATPGTVAAHWPRTAFVYAMVAAARWHAWPGSPFMTRSTAGDVSPSSPGQ